MPAECTWVFLQKSIIFYYVQAYTYYKEAILQIFNSTRSFSFRLPFKGHSCYVLQSMASILYCNEIHVYNDYKKLRYEFSLTFLCAFWRAAFWVDSQLNFPVGPNHCWMAAGIVMCLYLESKHAFPALLAKQNRNGIWGVVMTSWIRQMIHHSWRWMQFVDSVLEISFSCVFHNLLNLNANRLSFYIQQCNICWTVLKFHKRIWNSGQDLENITLFNDLVKNRTRIGFPSETKFVKKSMTIWNAFPIPNGLIYIVVLLIQYGYVLLYDCIMKPLFQSTVSLSPPYLDFYYLYHFMLNYMKRRETIYKFLLFFQSMHRLLW